ncbi:MAG: protein translocase subunit SecF [Candidatus Nanopelagicales bacterium]|nr:protein translocase subunit SecF [Candidatus Nanopelagicales bacterium]
MSRLGNLGQRLYDGKSSIDFVGKRKTWYVVSTCILIVAIGSLLIRGLNLGIEFRGGADFSLPNASCSVEQARAVAEAKTGAQSIVTVTGNGTVRVQTEPITTAESAEVASALSKTCSVPVDQIKIQVVGPTWGSEISKKAIQGLIVFIILVTLFMSIYFEWRMAVAGLIALAHDLIITVGLYSLFGLEVTPATVIGILTILGYSLYDTVVVFDKVKENTANISGQSVLTYSEAANLAVNQTLIRSINTSIVALLPVLAIIVVGAGLLGAGTLLDLAVALAIGMAAGAYSSIFVATPFLAQLKEKQPSMIALTKRVQARRAQAQKKVEDGGTEEFDANGHAITTLVDAGVRAQPKKLPRSKRPKK